MGRLRSAVLASVETAAHSVQGRQMEEEELKKRCREKEHDAAACLPLFWAPAPPPRFQHSQARGWNPRVQARFVDLQNKATAPPDNTSMLRNHYSTWENFPNTVKL